MMDNNAKTWERLAVKVYGEMEAMLKKVEKVLSDKNLTHETRNLLHRFVKKLKKVLRRWKDVMQGMGETGR